MFKDNMVESPVVKYKKNAKEGLRKSIYNTRVEEFKQKFNVQNIHPVKCDMKYGSL